MPLVTWHPAQYAIGLFPDGDPIHYAIFNSWLTTSLETAKLEDLIAARGRLIRDIRDRLDADKKAFLLSLHDCAPDFGLIGYPDAAALPAVRWKLRNLEKLKGISPEKHAAPRQDIESLF